jgi:hypothetical protein
LPLALDLKDHPDFNIPEVLLLMPSDTDKLKLAEALESQGHPGSEGLVEYVRKFHPDGIGRLRDWAAFKKDPEGEGEQVPKPIEPAAPANQFLAQDVA